MKQARALAVMVACMGMIEGHTNETLDIHVAPTGSDAGAGTAEEPMATLAAAQQQVRQIRARQKDQPIQVILHDGTWHVPEPLVFTTEDGGHQDAPVTWQAAAEAKPIISGGQPITGWQERDGRWVTTIPDAGTWYFRELLINGRWAQRARWPNADTVVHQANTAAAKGDFESTNDQAVTVGDDEQLPFIPWPQATQRWTMDTMDTCQVQFPEKTLPKWSNIADVELHYAGAWDTVIKRLADQQGDLITLQPPHAFFHQNIEPTGRADRVRWCHFENAPEMLDQPGEWYLDRATGTLSYIPLPDERIEALQAIAPRIGPHVIHIAGTAESPVQHLHFSGVTVAHASFELPRQGFNGLQAGAYFPELRSEEVKELPIVGGRPKVDHARPIPALPGSVSAVGWHNGSFRNGELRDSAAYGIHLRELCQEVRIEGNLIHQLGGGGIRIGENWRHHYATGGTYGTIEPALHEELCQRAPQRLVVSNNLVRHTGRNFWGTIGIWSSASIDLTISQNEVSDLPYTGISSGWFWQDDRPLANSSIRITNNRVINVLNRLADGGSIYCLGSHPDSLISGNVLVGTGRNRFTHRFPHRAVYFDGAGVKGFTVTENVFGLSTRDKAEPGFNTWGTNESIHHQAFEQLLQTKQAKPAIKTIFDASGLQPDFQHLRDPNGEASQR